MLPERINVKSICHLSDLYIFFEKKLKQTQKKTRRAQEQIGEAKDTDT